MEDGRMNVPRSICRLFGRQCAVEEPQPRNEPARGKPPVSESDLGQKEAELEKERMSHMESGDAQKK